MKTHWSIATIATLLVALIAAPAAVASDVTAPVVQYFAKRGGTTLKAVVHRPDGWKPRAMLPAVVILDGLGWTVGGEPESLEAYAKHYATLGMVGICPQYRPAKGTITPLDSMADARDAIRWIRANSFALGIDPKRIAVHALSTGAHLALSAAMFPGKGAPSPAPNALILYSPALDLENDSRIQPLLGDKVSAAEISPMAHVREGLPPTFIVQGDVDTVTPHPGAKAFCTEMTEVGNRCELQTYMYVGHLFTPKGVPDDKTPKPNPKVEEAALAKADAFLMSLGYIK